MTGSAGPFARADLSWNRCWKKVFVLFAAPDHPLAKRTVLQLEDFCEQVFLTNEKGCPYRTMFDRSFEKEGIDRIPYLEFQSAEAIKKMCDFWICFPAKIWLNTF